jgi:catechol 2,3-dioxygenase-like lactoylglutathione lyase family enzyme
MKLGHVNLYVRDAAASRDWYAKILGLHTYHSPKAGPRSCPPTNRCRMRSL